MIFLTLILLAQSNGDTLRWYDTTTAGYMGISYGSAGLFEWAIIFPIDSSLDGRAVHSGRVQIWEPMDYPGIMRLCLGGYNGYGSHSPDVLDSGSFHATDSLFFQEVFFGDTIALHDGDTIWLWCSQQYNTGEYTGSVDKGPAIRPWGDIVRVNGIWYELYPYGLDYNWVMELILTPADVEEGPAKPEGKLTLLPAPGGFYITGYEGPAQIYDPAGRLILSKDIKGKTLISPLRPGFYFVMAGKQRGKMVLR
ncbi:MAG: hypothetical protein ABIN58_07300 [candidate division WOR-3 bacterium]